ncbi:hypothetical protein V494_05430 [Pseudogymnoascus sp. VKM F-4513 (FW-928)]|nr:hypothetical protein V494_05430 [Pseudogymnoascus sp. VKM F-4513 (FW-928)]
MFAFKTIIALLASLMATNASPTGLATRQSTEIPPGFLYVAEWYPNGCGNGNGGTTYGDESTLAVCRVFNVGDTGNPDSAAVRFLFPEDDDRVFKWRLFGSNDCSKQIHMGQGSGCFNVPKGTGVGAIIVYT